MNVDDTIAALAARQHGVVARVQLLRAGVSAREVERRAACGRLRRVHRGVYRVGPVVAPHAAEMAAVLACGRAAFVSYRSGARLLDIVPAALAPPAVEVSVRGRERRRPGIRTYRVRELPRADVTRLEGIPVTTPARTLLDLARVLGRRDLERALALADDRGLTSPSRMRALLGRHPRHPGTPALRALLEAEAPPALTLSEAEEHFRALVEEADLPRPETNVLVGGCRVDFLWRAEGLIVEVDGLRYHGSRRSFEADRRRDAVLATQGFQIVRVTWRQMQEEPIAVAARLGQILGRARRSKAG